MGSCCSSGDDEKDKKFSSDGGDSDISKGPVQNRGCTDVLCIPILLAAQIVFIVVTLAGLGDGNPEKLYRPRDYRGSYCGVEKNWNGGVNTLKSPTLSYTMNVTATVDQLMKQMVCSTAAKKALVDGQSSPSIAPLLMTKAERDTYMCDCCLAPCAKCQGGLDKGDDILSAAGADIMTSKMKDLTDLSAGAKLFSPTGANGGTFSATSFWKEATKYFNQVCLPDCNTNFNSINSSIESAVRNYTYSPMKDDALYSAWQTLLNATSNGLTKDIVSTIASAFTFEAMPLSVCPYIPAYCVPFPGMEFAEVAPGTNFCQFKLASEVVNAVGSAASNAFASAGGEAFANAATEGFGEWIGAFSETIDTFIVVSLLSFVVGVAFLILLRFFIGVCVWLSIIATIGFFILGGAVSIVRSGQCADASFWSSGRQTAVAAAVAGATAASNAVSGREAISEAMTGDGQDYRGIQRYTKSGKNCAKWAEQTALPGYNAANYPGADLTVNYCRNPFNTSDWNKARTIWCTTNDAEVMWEECLPIGVIMPVCDNGYAVTSEKGRQALFYASFVIWAIGVLWVLIILCLINRIRLAIALNKVAAVFLAENVLVLLIPMVQALVCVIWMLVWAVSASFLLSQVPDSYIPTGGFATYKEAYGTTSPCAFWETGAHCAATPGKCTDKWPQGFVWKDTDCGTDAVPKCFKCAPPRYVIDVRFAISFFVFLWNNAFNVALGQILIAMAVSIWFFSKEKGSVSTVGKAVKTVFRYHVGSVAFGSFIVAVIQFIRYLMKYLEKQASAQKNRVMVLVFKVVGCIIWCFEKCVKFLNKNAYIQIALNGTPFCTSAKKAFFLVLRNMLRFASVVALSAAVNVIGFISIMVGTTVIGYFLVRAMHDDVNPVIPCVSYLVMSYIVAKLFMNVFGLAVDTSLQCFLACEEMGGCVDFIPGVLAKWVKVHVEKDSE